MTECRLCGEPIHFSDYMVSKRTGKKIPLSEGSDDPHSCAEYKAQNRRYYPCRECNAEIYFDDTHISKNGKHIPLSKATGEPHECKEVKAAQVSLAWHAGGHMATGASDIQTFFSFFF